VTSIPAVKAELVSVLAAALTDTQVVYGDRRAVTVAGPRLLLVKGAQGRSDFSDLASASSVELYEIECEASGSIPGTLQQVADELALAVFDAAVAAINAHDFVAAQKVQATGSFVLTEEPTERGRSAAVKFYVAVQAV
jgi:hypothetical protein